MDELVWGGESTYFWGGQLGNINIHRLAQLIRYLQDLYPGSMIERFHTEFGFGYIAQVRQVNGNVRTERVGFESLEHVYLPPEDLAPRLERTANGRSIIGEPDAHTLLTRMYKRHQEKLAVYTKQRVREEYLSNLHFLGRPRE